CVQGACACPAGQAFCGVECVDVQSDAAHCGSCENACSTGQTCKGGSCACPDGQMACGDACVDVQSDVQHCGTCDNACTLGKVCSAGSCIDGGGALLDDGCAGPAQNLTIEEIAVYQTVKVPVMREGEEVPAGERNADVVAGRESLFRIFVKPGTGFSARQLSARVHIETDGVTETYFSDKKPTISGASSDDEPDSTFQVFVPGDALQSSSQYSVEVVECGGGSGSGSVLRPRFPETGGIALRAVNTGVLKIAFVPIESNSSRPDTSEAALEPYRAMLLATYPITDVEMTVLGPMNTGYPINWPGVLDDLRAKRQSDGPPNDVYYYGLLKPTGTLREFCGGGCTTGIGYVPGRLSSGAQRVAVGIGFSDRASAETLAHEVAHNHGRLHAPCGNPDGADNNFPYSGGAVGVWGFDFRAKALIPPDRTDLMGYCNNKWLSDYTYQALVKSVQQVSGTASSVLQASGISAPWLVLLVDEQGSRWGHPIDEAVPPAGDPEAAEVLDASGQPIQTVTVYRTAISDMEAYSIEVPVPEPGWHSIRVAGAPVHPFSAPRGVVSP
ncbi:MAG TPA: M66 family metalloprotease, partial [Polyangiaceae bacterium]|nr:M66 family metalloprotease [Polyangiaceae bacterium]